MKITEERKKLILEIHDHIKNGGDIEFDYSAKCDLCGHSFDAIHKSHNLKADCPNCNNEVYTNAFDNMYL